MTEQRLKALNYAVVGALLLQDAPQKYHANCLQTMQDNGWDSTRMQAWCDSCNSPYCVLPLTRLYAELL